MTATSIPVAIATKVPSISLEKGFLSTPAIYEEIYAYAAAMGWMEKTFHFVVTNWLATRESVSA